MRTPPDVGTLNLKAGQENQRQMLQSLSPELSIPGGNFLSHSSFFDATGNNVVAVVIADI